MYGFYEECQRKYGNANAWKHCTEVFDYLNVAAVIDDKILCVHGGLSPDIVTVDQMRLIDRNQEIPHEGSFCDLMWSDPEDIEDWAVSPRGAGWLFGSRVTSQFCDINGLELVCRAHQLVQEGFKYMFPQQVPSSSPGPLLRVQICIVSTLALYAHSRLREICVYVLCVCVCIYIYVCVAFLVCCIRCVYIYLCTCVIVDLHWSMHVSRLHPRFEQCAQ